MVQLTPGHRHGNKAGSGAIKSEILGVITAVPR